MSSAIFQFYGIDWLASALAVAMIYNLGNGRRMGFGFGMAANLSWLAFAGLTQSVPILLANLVFLALNIRGWRAWATHYAALPHHKEHRV